MDERKAAALVLYDTKNIKKLKKKTYLGCYLHAHRVKCKQKSSLFDCINEAFV